MVIQCGKKENFVLKSDYVIWVWLIVCLLFILLEFLEVKGCFCLSSIKTNLHDIPQILKSVHVFFFKTVVEKG